MPTVAALAAIVNTYVRRTAGELQPWTDAQVTQSVTDALDQLWPDFGVLAYGEVATDGTQYVTIPTAFTASGVGFRLSRILVKNNQGLVADKATSYQLHINNQVFTKTRIASGNTFAIYGFVPYINDGSNLPVRLNSAIAMRAASFLYGMLAAALANSQRQQNLEQSRVISYQEALSLSAYYERRFQDATAREPTRVSYAPRASARNR